MSFSVCLGWLFRQAWEILLKNVGSNGWKSGFEVQLSLVNNYFAPYHAEFGYARKALPLGDAQSRRKDASVGVKALGSVGRHQTGFLVTFSFLSQGWHFAKESKLMLVIAFKTWNMITNFLPHWSLHCIREHNFFSYVCTVPSMRGNFLGGTRELRRQEVEQSVTNYESEMPAFERALLSLNWAL